MRIPVYLIHISLVFTYVASSTCKGTFSAPSGGSLPNMYELFGLGEEAYLSPDGTSGELLSLPLSSETDVWGVLDSPEGVIGGDLAWIKLLL